MRVITVWGIAGSGKTTWLAKVLNGETKLDNLHFTPENTVCLSFSRMAKKALQSKLNPNYTVNTFHSFISQLLAKNNQLRILSNKALNEFFANYDLPPLDQPITSEYTISDHIYNDLNKVRLLNVSPEEYAFGNYEKTIAFYEHFTPEEFIDFYQDFLELLEQRGSDYTDILVKGLQLKPDINNLVIDEANDLSPLMWKLVETWKPKQVLLVGDPNQNIFEFAGSKPDFLLAEKPIYELSTSYRVPHEILRYAIQYLVYPFSSPPQSSKTGGQITFTDLYSFIDHSLPTFPRNETTYILTYKRKTARQISAYLTNQNIAHLLFDEPPYPILAKRLFLLYNAPDLLTIDDLRLLLQDSKIKNKTTMAKNLPKKTNIRAVDVYYSYQLIKTLKNLPPEAITDKQNALEWLDRINKNDLWIRPRINTSTIHQIKGGEADNVFVYFDAHSYLDHDYTKRLYYVACTRSKRRLYIDEEKELRL